MTVRGVRGATTVSINSEESILAATQQLLEAVIAKNDIHPQDLAAAYFTVTSDLCATFPAKAARLMGWQHVPLLDALEIPVPGSLPRCVRVLLLWNTSKTQEAIIHIYQGQATQLRPDLGSKVSGPNALGGQES